MSRPIDDQSVQLQNEIFNILCDYADTQAVIPNPHALYHNILRKRGYNIKYERFRYHWTQLRLRGLVAIDPATGSVRIIGSKIVINSPDYAPPRD